jgi:hypothetical protein
MVASPLSVAAPAPPIPTHASSAAGAVVPLEEVAFGTNSRTLGAGDGTVDW